MSKSLLGKLEMISIQVGGNTNYTKMEIFLATLSIIITIIGQIIDVNMRDNETEYDGVMLKQTVPNG